MIKNLAVDSALRNGIILALFALLSIGLTTLTWQLTQERIQSEKELALLRAITELVPEDKFSNDPYQDCILVTDAALLGTERELSVWRLRDELNQPVAALISSVAPNGYSGNIDILVGHYTDGALAGVRVTAHNETPGLGDKVDTKKDDWILQFAGLSNTTSNPDDWKVKKDGGSFDAFTGATITPRAVLAAIRSNIDYYNKNQNLIFTEPSNCQINQGGSNGG